MSSEYDLKILASVDIIDKLENSSKGIDENIDSAKESLQQLIDQVTPLRDAFGKFNDQFIDPFITIVIGFT